MCLPAEVAIDDGPVPSAIDEGYATLNLTKAGCDCETSVVAGAVAAKETRMAIRELGLDNEVEVDF